ncbi:hypothetical protein, partial [Streptococcus suis]|uniref:hypothetical protein n=1 Tax=Streptococcus suis TaxID=1307 RepID=UPI001EE8F1A5
ENPFFLLANHQIHRFLIPVKVDFSSVRSKAIAEIGQEADVVVQPLFPLFPTVHGHIGNQFLIQFPIFGF